MFELELNNFTTCEISDALIKLGSPHGGHIPDICLQSPAQPDPNFRVSGPAFTVQMVHYSDKVAPRMIVPYLDTAPPKSFVVVDAPAHLKNAIWGGILTSIGRQKEIIGAVASGRCRDLADQYGASFPLFARGRSAVGQVPFARSTAVEIPIVIQPQHNASGTDAFPSITVESGDWVVADIDGVVCIPKGMVGQVVELAKAVREADARILEDIKAGKGVQASFKHHRGC